MHKLRIPFRPARGIRGKPISRCFPQPAARLGPHRERECMNAISASAAGSTTTHVSTRCGAGTSYHLTLRSTTGRVWFHASHVYRLTAESSLDAREFETHLVFLVRRKKPYCTTEGSRDPQPGKGPNT